MQRHQKKRLIRATLGCGLIALVLYTLRAPSNGDGSDKTRQVVKDQERRTIDHMIQRKQHINHLDETRQTVSDQERSNIDHMIEREQYMYHTRMLPAKPEIGKRCQKRPPISSTLRSKLENFTTISIPYKPFTYKEPKFLNEKDRLLFMMNPLNQEYLGLVLEKKRTGKIEVIHNGNVKSHSCGWETTSRDFRGSPENPTSCHCEVLCPLLVPDSGSFQHFMDGVIFKILQIQRYMNLEEIPFLLHNPKDGIVAELLRKLGVTENNIIHYSSGYISADYMINACVTPPMHPQLMSEMYDKLNSDISFESSMAHPSVILLTRKSARNRGRKMLNFDIISQFLTERYGDQLRIISGVFSLAEYQAIFSHARIVLGVHGAAFYNLIYCPTTAHIVEFQPTYADGQPTGRIAHAIFWIMSQLLNQTYWRVPVLPHNNVGDISINITDLESILDQADQHIL